MKLSNWIIGIILFAGVITGMTWMIADANNSGYNVNYGNSSNFDQQANIINLSKQIQDQTSTANIEQSNIFVTAAKQGYAAIRLVFNSVGMFTIMILGLDDLIQAPAWFGAIIIAIVGTLITFALLAYFSRWEA